MYKLSVEVQLILNRFIEHGANSPAVYGVLVCGKLLADSCLYSEKKN